MQVATYGLWSRRCPLTTSEFLFLRTTAWNTVMYFDIISTFFQIWSLYTHTFLPYPSQLYNCLHRVHLRFTRWRYHWTFPFTMVCSNAPCTQRGCISVAHHRLLLLKRSYRSWLLPNTNDMHSSPSRWRIIYLLVYRLSAWILARWYASVFKWPHCLFHSTWNTPRS